jgi:hypothetical protein
MKTAEIYALIVYLLLATLGTLGTVMYAVKPFSSFARFSNSFGVNFQVLINGNEVEVMGVKRFFQYFGSILWGANYFAFFSAWMAFHDHVSLAWWSLSYFPIMFLWHFLITRKEAKDKILRLIFLALAASALILTADLSGLN